MLELDIKFWIAVVGAALIRVITSERKSFVRSMLTVGMAVFAAWTFTDAALDWFNLPPATYRYPIAALLALTGEGVMRAIINAVNDPGFGIDLYNRWRGK